MNLPLSSFAVELPGDLDELVSHAPLCETTTASSSPFLWCSSRMSTTRLIHWASATDVRRISSEISFVLSLLDVPFIYVTIRSTK